MSGQYDDIIRLPHPDSPKHPRMSLYDRAAQFSPFAALTGHSAAIAETGRLTDQRMELDEYEMARVDAELQRLQELLGSSSWRRCSSASIRVISYSSSSTRRSVSRPVSAMAAL